MACFKAYTGLYARLVARHTLSSVLSYSCKAYTELCARLVVRSTFRPLAIDAAKAGLMPLVWEPRPRGLWCESEDNK